MGEISRDFASGSGLETKLPREEILNRVDIYLKVLVGFRDFTYVTVVHLIAWVNMVRFKIARCSRAPRSETRIHPKLISSSITDTQDRPKLF